MRPRAPAAFLLRALRIAAGVAVLVGASGCASLPFFGDREEKAAEREPEVELFQLEVKAPAPLRTLLLDYLDLSRFRTAPTSDAITEPELARLAAAAPAQARSLLETEGYFESEVTIERDGTRIAMTVAPGPRVSVAAVDVASTAPLAPKTPTREEPWSDRLDRVRKTWALPPGQPFRQPAWSSAKTQALGAVRADGYPKAEWASTEARVDVATQSAALTLTVDSGPLFRLGAVRVEGVHRYDEAAVRRLAQFFPGDVYSERRLLDYQERIVKSGLFEGASVELDASGSAEAAPVVVKVKELPQHQATFGVGFSANTGPRVTVEHWDRKVFGWPWISHSTLTYGPDLKSLGTELTSYPDDRLWRNLVAGNLEQLRAADETRNSWTVRAGRSKDTTRFDRLWYLETSHARLQSAPLTTSSDALSANYRWTRRDVDDLLLPTIGNVLTLQGGVGYGQGTLARSDRPGVVEDAKGPFARTYARFNWYRPVGRWYLNGRVEAGEVFVADPIAVPDTILFRAGGDNSVRGYGYRTLGPTINSAVVGGRVTATANIEAEHSLIDRLPALLGAVFVDAGNADDRWTALRPVFGVGAGLHYRSPVGPLRLDLAYGVDARRLRLHLSVGVTF